MVVPFGDKVYYSSRPTIAIPEPGREGGALDLDGFFGLHPRMASLNPYFTRGELAIIHATGSHDDTRSHFDAQDHMESGTPGVKSTRDGWLNRSCTPGSTRTPARSGRSRSPRACRARCRGRLQGFLRTSFGHLWAGLPIVLGYRWLRRPAHSATGARRGSHNERQHDRRRMAAPTTSSETSDSTDAPASPGAPAPGAPTRRRGSRRYLLAQSLGALGVVYGDIGTSPLYAVRECFSASHGLSVTPANVLGVLSLIFWSLIIVISVKYLAYVTRADNGGEGGILALTALAHPVAKRRARTTVLLVGLFGAALLYGDGIITPAISVLGAIEGLEVAAPGLESYVVPATVVILAGLFWFQKRGTAGVGAVFGPVTFAWFAALSALGVWQIAAAPEVLWAINPWHSATFLATNHWTGFLVLGAVFLVVTGGEALYADMGHFGRRPIVLTWFVLVLPALLLNYFGQGALLLHTPEAVSNPFYRMAPDWALYPMLVLATMAAIIASQAVISGAFSLSRQAAMLGYLPRMRIEHTSAREIGQVYVPGINGALFVCTMALVLGFESSSNLAAAYGIAVTITMVITTILAFWVAHHRWGWGLPAALGLTTLFLIVDLAFFGANIIKIEDGGWVPLLIAATVFVVMTTWKRGRQLLGARLRTRTLPLTEFFARMDREKPARVPGTAVFMTSNPEGTPPALLQNFKHNRVVHEQVVFLTIVTEESARVPEKQRVEVEDLGHGFIRVVAHYGFMEEPDIPALLARRDTPTPSIRHSTFFLGRETLLSTEQSDMPKWRTQLFALMARNAAQATSFFRIPPDRVFEVGSHIEL